MRPLRLLAILAFISACRAPREDVTARELPPLIPLPASFQRGQGSWTPDGRVTARIEAGAPESYRLDVTSQGASIVAADSAGLFYGRLTLQQLIDAGSPVRAIHVEDAPRFRYRGMHLDVARHFMPVDFVKRYIDLMSRYKMNTFHWHLTDDQGWRVQINKYPRLTEVGGCRKETVFLRGAPSGDGTPHCGFYTQDQVREVVAYARERFVTVIPEIEMPGHAKAVLAAYPEFACTPGPFEVRTTWGVDEDVFCPKEETFRFIEDVLDEVSRLFPGPYIHIGGDEVPKTRWRASPIAQEVMRRENLADANALQSWFIRRVERMLIARGKRLIGWDEILEGGLAPEATVMSWRGTAGGIAAARENHDVIMSPGSHLYFDSYQGDPKQEPLAFGGPLLLERVYEFEPVPDSLTPDQTRHILGAQANLWSEYMKAPSHVEYMAYPRALALAEVTWSPKASRSWPSFSARLPYALRSLDRLKVNYRLPDVEGLDGDRLTLSSSVNVRLSTVIPGATIRYTTDGSDPTESSTAYRAPFTVTPGENGVKVMARAFAADGRKTAARSASYRRTTLTAATAKDPQTLEPGLRYQYAELMARLVGALDTARVVRTAVVDKLERRGDERPERYGIRFAGYIRVPADGLYEFSLISDDGSNLSVAGKLVVDNDGYHGADEKTGMIALSRGLHPFLLRYAQATGGAALSLRVRREGETWQPVPKDWLFHDR
jgi:hexosaminidase